MFVYIKNKNGEEERHRARDRAGANGILHDQLFGNEEALEVWVVDDDGSEIMRTPAAVLREKIEAD